MDWLSTLIGAAIGFVSSIGIVVIQRLLDKAGKLELFAKVVYDHSTGSYTWGFHNSADGIFLKVPIWIEIQNLSKSARILRDINLLLISNGKFIASMDQSNRATINGKESYLYANKGSYSLSIEGGKIVKIDCSYMLKACATIPAFDEIQLQYFDEKNHPHRFSLGKVAGDWQIKEFPRSGEWIKLKEIK